MIVCISTLTLHTAHTHTHSLYPSLYFSQLTKSRKITISFINCSKRVERAEVVIDHTEKVVAKMVNDNLVLCSTYLCNQYSRRIDFLFISHVLVLNRGRSSYLVPSIDKHRHSVVCFSILSNRCRQISMTSFEKRINKDEYMCS